MISKFIRDQWESEGMETVNDERRQLLEEAVELDQIWGIWDGEEECAQFCSKDELGEAAKEEEMKIPWQEAQEELPVPEGQYQERFWR